MTMKRIGAAVLVAVMLAVTLCGCGGSNSINEKDNKVLPYGMKFGMSYEALQDMFESVPALETDEYGYVCADFVSGYPDEYEEFFGVDGAELYADMLNGSGAIVYDPIHTAYFNESGELRRLDISTTIYNDEAAAEYLLNVYAEFIQRTMGIEPTLVETDTYLDLSAQTESLAVTAFLYAEDAQAERFGVSITMFCKSFE